MAELARRLARGEPAAFAELYDACAHRLFRYLCVHLGSPADAEDVVQETFVRLAQARHRLKRVENLMAYVFTVARNEAARLKQRRGRLVTTNSEAEISYDDRAARDAIETIRVALDRLPIEQRAIVELKTYGGLTLREIAETTALPAGTVATRYRTAVQNLRRWMSESKCHE